MRPAKLLLALICMGFSLLLNAIGCAFCILSALLEKAAEEIESL